MRSWNSLMRERREAFRDARLIVIASEGKITHICRNLKVFWGNYVEISKSHYISTHLLSSYLLVYNQITKDRNFDPQQDAVSLALSLNVNSMLS